MLSGFTFEQASKTYAFYSKQIGDYSLQFYVGDWGWDLGDADSDPLDPNLNIYDYNYVYVELIFNDGSLCPAHYEQKFNIQSLGFDKHRTQPVMSYSKFSIAQLEVLHDAIELHENISVPTAQVGGTCSICNFQDPWACWKNGKCYCYSHTPGVI